MSEVKKVRNSSLELLRIISMFLIVMTHYCTHGFSNIETTYGINKYLTTVVTWGGIGTNIFVLISGYFMVQSKFTVNKLLKLLSQVVFYSLGFLLCFTLFLQPVYSIGIKEILKSILPVGYSLYWFITSYTVLMLFSPLLNMLISKIDKGVHLKLLVVGGVIWSIMPTLTLAGYGFNTVIWFAYLYFVAAYVRKYVDISKHNYGKNLKVALIGVLLMSLSACLIIFAGEHMGSEFISNQARHFYIRHTILPFIVSVEMLIAFSKMKPFYSNMINAAAAATAGVYLIHDNILVRPYLWQTVFKNGEFYGSDFLFVHAIGTILAVYIGCTLIDIIRHNTVGKLIDGFIDRHTEGINKRIDIFLAYVQKTIDKAM